VKFQKRLREREIKKGGGGKKQQRHNKAKELRLLNTGAAVRVRVNAATIE